MYRIDTDELIKDSYRQVASQGDVYNFLVSFITKNESFVIGVEGASASGKTTFVTNLVDAFPQETVASISLDDYVVMSKEEMVVKGIETRYDWCTRDRERFLADLKALRSGKSIEKPKQDFLLERPSQETETVAPKPYILVDGNLDITDVCDLVIFLVAPDEVLVQRRFERDKRKSIHSDEEMLMESIQNSIEFYHIFLEPHMQKADFILDTHAQKLYQKNSN